MKSITFFNPSSSISKVLATTMLIVALTLTGCKNNDSPNKAPKATDDSAVTDQNVTVTIKVLDNDSDPDGNSLKILEAGSPSNGKSVIKGSAIDYTPKQDFVGSDSFTYKISDGKGGEASAKVTVTVNAVNKAPVATDDTAMTNQNQKVSINVLSNDTDPDGDNLSISEAGSPNNGTATINGSSIDYTPKQDFVGSDSFTYKISDGKGGEASAKVTVTINAVPVAVDDTATTTSTTAAGVLVSINVLANDTDADGDTLSITSITTPGNGATVINGTAVDYTPNANYSGTDTFSYEVSDGNGGTATANVVVTVSSDKDGDGVIDAEDARPEDPNIAGIVETDVVTFAFKRYFDSAGRITKYEYYAVRNGSTEPVLNVVETITWNENGPVKAVLDDLFDDSRDGTTYYTLDTNGNIIREEQDLGDNGVIDNTTTYTYDANGNETGSKEYSGTSSTPSSIETKTYDGNSNLLRYEYDENGNGTADFIETYAYNSNGNYTRREKDTDGNGVMDKVTNYIYDAAGKLTRKDIDTTNNGTFDSITTYTYDAKDEIIRGDTDTDSDGVANSIITYTYDADGNRIKNEYDTNADGTVNSSITVTTNGFLEKADLKRHYLSIDQDDD